MAVRGRRTIGMEGSITPVVDEGLSDDGPPEHSGIGLRPRTPRVIRIPDPASRFRAAVIELPAARFRTVSPSLRTPGRTHRARGFLNSGWCART